MVNAVPFGFEELSVQVLSLQGLNELDLDLVGFGERNLDPRIDRFPRRIAPSMFTSGTT